jgi:hypothetical protein
MCKTIPHYNTFLYENSPVELKFRDETILKIKNPGDCTIPGLVF